MKNKNLILPLTLAFAIGFVNPALAAEVEKEIDKNSEGILIAEIGDNNKQKVLPAAETNKDTLNFMELVDSFTIAEKIPTSRWDTPANVTVITSQEIAANKYQSVPEALSHVNGVFVGSSLAAFLNGTTITIFLVDGHRAHYYPSIKAVERIEILKGGETTLYGADAVGGVVNVITKKGERTETEIDLNTGSWKTHTYKVTTQGFDGRFGWFIDGTILKQHPYSFSGDETATNNDLTSDRDDKQVAIRLDNKFDDSSSLNFRYQYSDHYYNNYPSMTYTYWDDVDETDVLATGVHSHKYYEKGNEFLISYNFKENTNVPGYLRYFNNYSESNSMPDSAFNVYYEDVANDKFRTQGIDYQNGWELGKHKIIAGFEWHRTNHSSYYWDDVSKKMTNTAYYLQDTISLNNKWTLIPGIRLDHNTEYKNKWSPKIAANYRADEKTKIYASWGKVYRAPNTNELYRNKTIYDDDHNPIYRYYSTSLKPETGHVETIGFEHDFDDKTRLTTSLFNAKLSNLIGPEIYYYGFAEYSQYRNHIENKSADAKYRGFELNFNKQVNDNWSYELGYTLLHVDDDNFADSAYTFVRFPRHSYRVGLHFQDGGFKANLLGIMGHGKATSSLALKNYAVLDFNTSYDVTDWGTVYLRFCNFTNQNYSYFGQGFHSPGRSFMAGITCKF